MTYDISFIISAKKKKFLNTVQSFIYIRNVFALILRSSQPAALPFEDLELETGTDTESG